MASQTKRRGRTPNAQRTVELQGYVNQSLTLKQIGQRFDPPVTGERVRQLIAQLGITGPTRKRGRRPRPVEDSLSRIDIQEFKQLYYGDADSKVTQLPLAELGKRFNMSTTRVRKLLRHLKMSKRASLPRPRRKSSRIYDVEKIRDLYVEKRWSDQRIADHLRESAGVKAYASYINLLRNKNGIKRDPLKPSERKNAKGDVATQLRQYLEEGLSPKEIAYKIPCSSSYVYRLIKEHKLNHLLPSKRDDDE